MSVLSVLPQVTIMDQTNVYQVEAYNNILQCGSYNENQTGYKGRAQLGFDSHSQNFATDYISHIEIRKLPYSAKL